MIKLPSQIVQLAQLFNQSTPLYLVGGVVRNYLLGLPLSDFDVASCASSEEVKNYLKDSQYRITAEYPRTGTLLIECDGIKLEYTSFREDSYPINSGTHTPAVVTFTRDLRVDALRRDFTCNALYYDIVKDEIIDVVGGVKDIENRVLRTVREGEKTLREDALRIMRMVRFAMQLGFTVDAETFASSKKYANGLKEISVERVQEELMGIINAPDKYGAKKMDGTPVLPSDGIRMLVDCGAMQYIIPELLDGIGMEQNTKYHVYDVYNHILKTLDNCPRDIRLAGLMHDIAKPILQHRQGNMYGHDREGKKVAEKILTRLKFPMRDIERVSKLVSLHMFNLDNKAKDSTIRKFIAENYQYVDDYIALRIADGKASREEHFDRTSIDHILAIRDQMLADNVPLTVADMEINGEDMLRAGYKGKEIGIVLYNLLLEQITKGIRYDRIYMLDRIRR